MTNKDLTRLSAEYQRREQDLGTQNRYRMMNEVYLFMIQQRERAMLSFLKQNGVTSLEDKQVLEVGCGSGGVLQQFLSYEAKPENLHGIDILAHRLEQAQKRFPHLPFNCADGQALPYASKSFDIVMQFTAFSSLLDDSLKYRVAQEMLRVCRPDGLILWYDFWLNPNNPQTKGIRPKEIRRLFPNSKIRFKRTTLAPPISRAVVPISWLLAVSLEGLQIFNSHYFAIIHHGAS